jgi:hypothetical protein
MTTPTIDMMMEAYAEDAVDWAQQHFQAQLDYSEASLDQVEQILDRCHTTIPKGRLMKLIKRYLSPEDLDRLAKMFGGYVGEVMRRQLGGHWTLDSGIYSEPTITLVFPNDSKVFPASKVYKRIINGGEDRIPFFYQVIKMKAQEEEGHA